MNMKKDVTFIIIYNIVFLAVAIIFKEIEYSQSSILYMVLLLLVSDLFFVVFKRRLRNAQEEMLNKIKKNQEVLIEQERLSSLGQLIGGIAHNLKTPIMSISGALEGLSDLVKEYDESIYDSSVTKDDHHEIASDMKMWIDKIRPYLSYMTEIIDAVKGQAVSMNAVSDGDFLAKEFILRTQILMKDELKRRKCNLNVEANISDNTKIKGELNALVQILDNLIMNAMDAYKENGGDIKLSISEDDNKVYISVCDFAGGIPEHIREKLFNEMVTTKGKKGTGLGLYMSYSTIKGKFNGDMRFVTKENEGTTFYIELNKSKI